MLRYSMVRRNPDYEYDGSWMYFPKDKAHFENDTKTGGQHFNTMSDGERVQYKFHICPELSDYLSRTRKIILNFLHKNKIYHKMVGNKYGDFDNYIANETYPQYGKPFTIYCSTLEEFYIVTKGMQQLVKKYKIKGVDPSKFKELNSNMQYERPVPGTNNTLYYTVEMATVKAVEDSIRSQKPEYISYADIMGGMLVDMDGVSGFIGAGVGERRKFRDGVSSVYLKSPAYALRELVMEHYWGQGPIDFLWSGDINTELPPPPKPKKGGLRKTKPGPPHSKNNHFNGSAPRRSSDPGEPLTGEIEILDPNVRPGTPDNPVCSNCLEYYHDKVSYDKFADDSSKTTLLFMIDDNNDQYDNRDSYYRNCVEAIKKITPHFTKYLTNGKVNLEVVGPIFRSKYSKYIPAPNFGAEPSRPTGTGQGLRRKGGTALLKDKMEEEFGPHRIIQITAGRGYAMPQSYHILGSTRTPQSWAEIHCHELCHYLAGNLNPRSYGIYHTGWGAADTHCPYNCLIHHYISCGNIAARHEGAIYNRFVR